MTTLQAYQLWIGLGFVAVLVLFLMVAFFIKEKLSEDQRQILRFLCALCAGFAGALIAGDALFKLNTSIGTATKIAVSGTAGFALFFAIWFTFRQIVPPPDAVHFSIPPGWTFRQAALTLTKQEKSFAHFDGFNEEELNTPVEGEVHTKHMTDALLAIKALARKPLPAYQVAFEDPGYRITAQREDHGIQQHL